MAPTATQLAAVAPTATNRTAVAPTPAAVNVAPKAAAATVVKAATVAAPAPATITSLTLINADTGQPITGYTSLTSGVTLNLATLPTRNLNIRANTSVGTIGSVVFTIDDGTTWYHIDNNAPYALAGNSGPVYAPWTPPLGSHRLVVAALTGANATGTLGPLFFLNFTVTNAAVGGSTPFSGTPIAVPGLIEAENFDNGGQGIAYNDTTPGNAGGSYRATDVDVEPCADVNGGYNIGHIVAGEWLKYTVNVAASGSYYFDARLASAISGGAMHIEVDGVNVTGAMSFPNTGGWQTWATVTSAAANLSAGTHVIRVSFDGAATSEMGNLNWLQMRAANAPTITWSAIAASPLARLEAQCATVNGKFYVFGGFYDYSLTASREVDVYDPATRAWARKNDLPYGLTHSATVSDGQYVYLIGGERDGDSGVVTTDVWRYDTVTDTLAAMPSLPLARAAGGAGIVGRTLYFYGGLVQGFQVDGGGEGWKLNLDSPASGWAPIANMPNPRNHLGSAAIGGKVYAVGGQLNRDETNHDQLEVDAYDPTTNTWSRVADLPQPLGHISGGTFVFAMQARIVVAAGETLGATPVDTLYSYNPATNAWTLEGHTPAPRKSPVAGVLGNSIIFGCGSSSGGIDATSAMWVSGPVTLI